MGGAGGNTGPPKPLWMQMLAFFAFAAGNMGLNLLNSWALRGTDEKPSWDHPSFTFPVFYTMFHMIISSLVALILMATVVKPESGLPSFSQFWEYKGAVIPIACCTFLTNSLNNMSLTMVSLFVNQVIKAQMPLLTMLFSIVRANKKYSAPVIATVVCCIVGSVLANADSFLKPQTTPTSLNGVIICIVGLVASALRPVISMIAMEGSADKPKLAPTQVLFYDCFIAFFLMLAYWAISPERELSLAYMSDPEQRQIGLTVIAAGSSLAFEFNLANYTFIMVTSALTSAIGANSVKIVLITYAAFLANVTEPLSWTGIVIVVSSVAAYAYFSFTGAQKPAEPPKDDKADALLNEDAKSDEPVKSA